MSGLPEGWRQATLEHVARWGSGGTPSRRHPEYYGGTVPWIKTGELGTRTVHSTEETLSDLGLANSSAKLFPRGAVAIAMYGATIGKTSILGIDAATNQACAVAVPERAVTTTEYLYHYLCSQREAFVEAGKGGAQPNISQGVIKSWPIPLAPLAEQKRIADKLDTLLARVDACRTHLARIPAILKRFRQSVLAAATSGELTREWRDEHELGVNDWSSATVDDLIDRIESGINVQCIERPPTSRERGLVKISAVTWGRYNDDESKTLPPEKVVPDVARIKIGDFLISRANTLELVGACVVVDRVNRPVYLSDKVLRLVMPEATKQWMLLVLRSTEGRRQIESLASGNQLSMRNLSQANLRKINIPMPPPGEQAEIVRRVESLFALADQLEARYTTGRAHLDHLTPALLAKAFRGELVPQDPNDEPVAALLAGIAARQSAASAGRPRRPRIGRSPRAPKETASMTKSRQDDDVMGQPYLAGHLRRIGTPASAEALFKVSELPVADFYKQLAWEVAQGHVKDNQDSLEPGHAAG